MVTRGLSGITFSEPSLWWPSPVKPPPKSISQPLIYKFVPSYFLSRFTRLFHNPSILYPSLSAHHQLQKLRIQSSKSPLPLLFKFFNSIILRYREISIWWFQESSKFSLKKLSSRCKIEILSIRKYSLGTLGVKTRLPPPLPSSWPEIARLTSFGGSAVIRFTWKAKRAKCTTRCNTGQQYVIHFNRTRCLALRPPSSLCTPLHRPSLSFTFDSLPPPLISTRLRHRAPFSSFARITGQAGPGNWFPRDGRVSGIGD